MISVENCRIFPPRVLCAPLKGLPLELGIGAWSRQTRMMVLPGRERSLDDIFSRRDTIHERDGRTDERTLDDSKDRVYA